MCRLWVASTAKLSKNEWKNKIPQEENLPFPYLYHCKEKLLADWWHIPASRWCHHISRKMPSFTLVLTYVASMWASSPCWTRHWICALTRMFFRHDSFSELYLIFNTQPPLRWPFDGFWSCVSTTPVNPHVGYFNRPCQVFFFLFMSIPTLPWDLV